MKVKTTLLCWTIASSTVIADELPHLQKELRSFYLPETRLENASLQDVITGLKAAYRKHSKAFTGKEQKIDITINSKEQKLLSGFLPNQSIETTLYQISGQTGMTVIWDDHQASLNPIPTSDKRMKSAFKVHPNFLRHLAKRASQPKTTVEGPKKFLDGELTRTLFNMKLFIDQKSLAAFDKLTGTLTLKSTVHEKQRVTTFLKSMQAWPAQIRLTSRFIAGAEGEAFPTGKFHPKAVQTWMRAASQKKGCNIFTLPSLVALPGQDGQLEITQQPRPFDDESWTGKKLSVVSNLRGQGVTGEFTFHLRDDQGNPEQKITEVFRLKDGQTGIWKMPRRNGVVEHFVLTAERIDATGKCLEGCLSNLVAPPQINQGQ